MQLSIFSLSNSAGAFVVNAQPVIPLDRDCLYLLQFGKLTHPDSLLDYPAIYEP